MLRTAYIKLAIQVAESLREDLMDLDRFLPVLHQEILAMAKEMNASAGDWEPGDLTWAANQERDAKLHLEGLTDAIAELTVVHRYALPTDDQLNLHHVKSAAATLQNLKRRMEL